MAGKYPNGKGRPGRKRKWKDMCITRVKLNPEQAVITCCNDTERGLQLWAYSCIQSGPGYPTGCTATGENKLSS